MTTGTTPSVISKDTIHITLGTYVDVFVQTAEDTCNRKVCDETVMPFLDALRGLASISHILLEAALEELSHTHPRESLSEYALNCDVKAMQRQYDWQMSDLEAAIRNAPPSKGCEVPFIYFNYLHPFPLFLNFNVAQLMFAVGVADDR